MKLQAPLVHKCINTLQYLSKNVATQQTSLDLVLQKQKQICFLTTTLKSQSEFISSILCSMQKIKITLAIICKTDIMEFLEQVMDFKWNFTMLTIQFKPIKVYSLFHQNILNKVPFMTLLTHILI